HAFHIALLISRLLFPDASFWAHHARLVTTVLARFSGYVGSNLARSGGIRSNAFLLRGPIMNSFARAAWLSGREANSMNFCAFCFFFAPFKMPHQELSSNA